MIKSLKYVSLAILFISLTIHVSTFADRTPFNMDNVWFMQIAVLTVFGVMIFQIKKLKIEIKRKPEQTHFEWFKENLAFQLMEKNNLEINAIPGCLFFLGIFAVAYVFVNFFSCLAGLEFGSPIFENGQYLLENHGRLIRALTEAEYLKMKAYELRLFSGHWMIFSYAPLLFFIYVYPATMLKREHEIENR